MNNLAKTRIQALGVLSITLTVGWILFIIGYIVYANTEVSDIGSFWVSLTHKQPPIGSGIADCGLVLVMVAWICSLVYGGKILSNINDFTLQEQRRASMIAVFGLCGGLLMTNVWLSFTFPETGYVEKITEIDVLKNQLNDLQKQIEAKKVSAPNPKNKN